MAPSSALAAADSHLCYLKPRPGAQVDKNPKLLAHGHPGAEQTFQKVIYSAPKMTSW